MNLKNKKKWILLPLGAGVAAPLALLTTVSATTENVTTTNTNPEINAPEGRLKFNNTKNEAVKSLNDLSFLSDEPYPYDSEKFKASEAIKSAKSNEELQKAIEDAKALNKANYDAQVSELESLTNQYLASTYGTEKANVLRKQIENKIAMFNSKSYKEESGEKAVAKAQNLLDLVDYLTSKVSEYKFNKTAKQLDLANLNEFKKLLTTYDYFNIQLKDRSDIKSDDVKNMKQLALDVSKIKDLNVLVTAVKKSLVNRVPRLVWPYVVAGSLIAFLSGIFIATAARRKNKNK
ncbi:hypothetical protein VBM89_01180 [Mycoplasma sp. 1199]|uniref:hypothetical protein n=1 Tax=Mycoplasma sp. 1199 TaxID=3108526 RepID=UPI002B1D2B09|nr:hypothetical protein [Mycoplasma sp. 1199]MEA4206121.1 hypothetical protein [Mycoplasma sp. 1199]